MNRLSKILLFIIIILLIALGIMTYLYSEYKNSNEKAVLELHNAYSAIENSGFKIEKQENNTFILVEREIPVKRDEV